MSAYDEDDEDAFLYGNASTSSAPAPTSATPGITAAGKEGTPSTASTSALAGVSGDAAAINPPISLTENGTASVVGLHENGQQERQEQEEEDDNDEMDESDGEDAEQQQQAEDSDDDLEIIMDINPSGPNPSHNIARQVGAVPAQPVPPPVAQAQLQRATSTPAQPQFQPAKQESVGPARSTPNPFLTFPSTTRQTGAPIPTPSRAPAPDVNNTSAVFSQRSGSVEPDAAPLDFKPIVQPIIDVDLDSIEEKNWRKPGANLADYFNYGFDEPSWKAWASRQRTSREDRERERENPFSIFANRPLPEAWNSLPMELKGMMMQTIMTSFNAGPGGAGGMQQNGMNLGMGMQGMQGMQGMMPGMQNNMAGPGNMGMNPMAGMGGNPMMNQMQQQGMGGGGMNGFGNQGGDMNMGSGNNNMGNMGGMSNPMMAQMQQQFGGGGMGMGMGMGMGGGGGNNTPNAQMQMQQRGMMGQQQQQGTPRPESELDFDNADNESSQQQSNYDDEEVDPSELAAMNAMTRPASSDFSQQQFRPSPGQQQQNQFNQGGFASQQQAFNRGRGGNMMNNRGGGNNFNRGGGNMRGGRGGMMGGGRGGMNMSPPGQNNMQQQNQRHVSPLPDNLPKGPRSMLGAGRGK